MNIVKTLIARIEEARSTNKNPCKSYATEEAAEKVAQEMAQMGANYFFIDANKGIQARPMNYIVAFDEAWGRWVIGFDMNELLSRSTSTGGYIGILGQKGFYCL